jgi:peptidoglycan/xylan/chitin deacetylase (PgdA/CDA1 family)
VLNYFLGHGYRFVSPTEIAAGLEAQGRYAWLTFDDGYANNLRAVEILREYGVPATFFISTNYVIEGKSFWWDVIHRERSRRGMTAEQCLAEIYALQTTPRRDIEAFICAEFGAAALQPIGDTDRPMTAAELRRFATEPLVTVGNHTADHALLTVLADDAVRDQITMSQTALREMTGTIAEVIAYPHGLCDDRVVRLASEGGLRMGAVVVPKKNRPLLTQKTRMTVARYLPGTGQRSFDEDCLVCRSDVQLINLSRRARQRRGGPSPRS